ncbi:MAG: trypsin-like peptidase domain-containing protein [Ruminococcus sp.]|nr:trypsin-like peptidase domain-containing protein [Ruminococcus sp.]
MTEMVEKKKNGLRNGIVLIVIFFLGMLAMYGVFYFFPSTIGTVVTKLEKDVTIDDKGIADAVEKVYDSVVVVNTYARGEAYASGTGFVYKVEGNKAYLLTNNHVISNADDVYVTFTDGTIVKTEIVGSDVYSDIAVLAVDKEYIKAVAAIGKSEDLRLGDTVFAIGAPLDSAYSWSVTRGILSGKDRLVEVELTSGTTKTPMVVNTLQTDAAINSGNSGGPLANGNGEVIGITSIKLASSSIEGMGFAIPIETALEYAETLISGKDIERPYLGVYMLDVTDAYYYREYYNLIREANVTQGIVVTDIEDKSSASLAGVKKNDIITKVDGHEISGAAYLRYYLYKHEVGDEMKLTILRDNKEMEIKVRLVSK